MRAQSFTLVIALGLGTLALALAHVPDACPFGFGAAQRVSVEQYAATNVWTRVGMYQVGGNALLDYMPRFGPGPMFRVGPPPHPLNVSLSVSAETRPAAERASFRCVRVRHGGDLWSLRPTNYRVESPQWDLPGPSWRLAMALGGPEWPTDDVVTMEAWLAVDGETFVLEFPPFALMRGG